MNKTLEKNKTLETNNILETNNTLEKDDNCRNIILEKYKSPKDKKKVKKNGEAI